MTYFAERVTALPGRHAVTSSNVIILAQDGSLCLQRRTADAPNWPSALSFWGGAVEGDENFDEALQRELQEELGVDVPADQFVYLGTHEYDRPGGLTLAARYFWHDRDGRVQNCYEGTREYLPSAAAALADPTLHQPGTAWCLEECVRRKLIA